MALTPKHFAIAVLLFSSLAFIFGVIAKNKKPLAGSPIHGKGVVICKFPNDPTIAFGSLPAVVLPIPAFIGVVAVLYPYKRQSVSKAALFHGTLLAIFFTVAVGVTVLEEAMMMWVTITEGLHHTHGVHHNLDTDCPTTKTSLFGSAAFVALDAALFWHVCQMLTDNARTYFLEDEYPKGTYKKVLTANHDASGARQQGAPRV